MLDTLFTFDTSLLESPAGQRAHRNGLLRAKKETLQTAQWLARTGRPLQVGVLFVSFVHIFSELLLIKPQNVVALGIPDNLFHMSAGAFTFIIDCVALYVLAAASVSAYIGHKSRSEARWFFYFLTTLLNGAFVISFMPNLPTEITTTLPYIRGMVALLLALLVPVSLASIEAAHKAVEYTRLGLLTETTVLAELTSEEANLLEKTRAENQELKNLLEQEKNNKSLLEEQRKQMEATRVENQELQRLLEQTHANAALVRTQLEQTKSDLLEQEQWVARLTALIKTLERAEASPPQDEEETMCQVCGTNILTAQDKSIAGRTKWKTLFDGKYACKECREHVES